MSDLSTQIEGLADKSLLLLDDDTALRTRLGRALEGRGFEPVLAASVTEALAAVKVYPPAFAVLDMRLEKEMASRLLRIRRTHLRKLWKKVVVVDHVSRPLDKDRFVHRLRHFSRARRFVD